MTRPAAKVFAECDTGEQLDGQNHPTAGKEPDRHFKMKKQRIQDDPQDVVAMLTIGRERKVQNHVYQQLGLATWATETWPLPSNSRPYGVIKYLFPLKRPSGGRLTSHEL